MKLKDPLALLSWPTPNYVDPVTRGPALNVICGVFFTLATVAVYSRLYARIFIRKWFGWDDLFVILGWVGS
jgi:hypothetical protein